MQKKLCIKNGYLVITEQEDSAIEVYLAPNEEERKHIINDYNIDTHTLLCALDPDEVSHVEFDEGNIFLIWKCPQNCFSLDEHYFNVSSIGLFLFPNKLILILAENIPLFDRTHYFKSNSLLEVMLSFLYHTIRHYLEHLKAIKLMSREIQEKVNTSMENEHLIQMFNLVESLVYYLNAISSNNMTLQKLRMYFEKAKYPEDKIDILDDIMIENTQCYKQAEIYSQVMGGLMESRSNIVNNNMNILMKKLTIINIIFLPLNLIASIGGMSEVTDFFRNFSDSSNISNPIPITIGYLAFCLLMVGIGWLTAYLLNSMDVVEKKKTKRKRNS